MMTAAFALTTYDDAAKIMQELSENHVTNLALRYIGWTKGGLSNQYIDEVRHSSLLGGTKSWNTLSTLAASQNVDIYMDMDLAYVQRTSFFDDFSANLDCCRTVRNMLCGSYVYNYGDNKIDNTQLAYGISANKLHSDVANLFKSIQSHIKSAYISAGTLGTALNSTFKSDAVLTRPQAQQLQAESLKKLATDNKVMLENANAYTLPFCQSVINLSVTSSGYASTDYDVPFYQLVLNGYVEYSASPLNESENVTDNFLKAIETNASMNYIVAYRNQNELKSSSQSRYYSVNYGVLKDEIAETYAEFEKVNQSIGDSIITDHQRLADNVFQTTYSNGTIVAVNYGDKAYSADSMVVPAKGYLCTEGGHTP